MRADDKHLGNVWTDVVFRRDILWMIRSGYLCDVKGYTVEVDDLALPTARGTDYKNPSLGAAIVDSSAGAQVVKAWQEHANGRPTVLFAPTVDSALMFMDVFNDAGIPAECVTGKTSTDERRAIYRRVKNGVTRILCNCMVLTEGFDLPPLSCCIVARPTQSQGFYIQMVGRVLRTFPGKTDAIVLDIAGVATQHSLCSLPVLTSSKRRDISEGETLATATARWEDDEDGEGYWDDTDQPAPAPLQLTEVDLFARSRAAWQKTRRDHWFIATRSRVYFLREQTDGLYSVWVTRSLTSNAGRSLAADLPLDLAMDHGESLAMSEDSLVTDRGASWRRGRRHPSDAQLRMAQSMGIDPSGLSRNELSNAISLRKVEGIGL